MPLEAYVFDSGSQPLPNQEYGVITRLESTREERQKERKSSIIEYKEGLLNQSTD
tara:strand:+ start:214 stop:378 length:165 start_codon:yes stop_codon:yes gene_type:complete